MTEPEKVLRLWCLDCDGEGSYSWNSGKGDNEPELRQCENCQGKGWYEPSLAPDPGAAGEAETAELQLTVERLIQTMRERREGQAAPNRSMLPARSSLDEAVPFVRRPPEHRHRGEEVTEPEKVLAPYELWRQAGGDPIRYIELMREHGHITDVQREAGLDIFGHPLAPDPGAAGEVEDSRGLLPRMVIDYFTLMQGEFWDRYGEGNTRQRLMDTASAALRDTAPAPEAGRPCANHQKLGFIYSVIGCPDCYPALRDTAPALDERRNEVRHDSEQRRRTEMMAAALIAAMEDHGIIIYLLSESSRDT